ncbi:helix-turn-helix transcriptional regulator [Streptomyces racemochromogenes]|uniref:helix-turn-helix domain-containing protein n=1 Tax=Streptomyces racemochromogenes TaxID=67353 RepID=UPI0031E9B8A3
MMERILEVGRIAREARAQLGLTQEQLAERAGISRATLQNLERDGRARDTTLAKVEQALGLPPGAVVKAAKGLQPLPALSPVPSEGLTHISAGALGEAVSSALLLTADSLTAAEIREVTRLVVEDLRARGVVAAP